MTTTVHSPTGTGGRMLRRLVLDLFTTLSGAYGVSVTLFLFARWTVGERWGPIGLFNMGLHLLIAPAVLLLPLLLLTRRRGLALALTWPALLFLTSYGPLFLPRTVSGSDGAPALTLFTYNLNRANRGTVEIERIIRQADADVVALQELHPDVAAALEPVFASLYPYRALHPRDGFTGQGVLSRLPILDDAYWPTALGHQRVTLAFEGQTIALHNTHAAFPFRGLAPNPERRREIDVLLEQAGQETGRVILAGDFNLTDQTEDYGRITTRYSDVFRAVGGGMGFTFPDLAGLPWSGLKLPPLARIDYVFTGAGWRPLQAQTWPESGGSDHRPLWVRLALT